MFWLFAPLVGPSDATSATRTSPGVVVLKAGVVCGPAPSAENRDLRCRAWEPERRSTRPGPPRCPPGRSKPPAGVWLMTDAGRYGRAPSALMTVEGEADRR
jgi:hypothetical protein